MSEELKPLNIVDDRTDEQKKADGDWIDDHGHGPECYERMRQQSLGSTGHSRSGSWPRVPDEATWRETEAEITNLRAENERLKEVEPRSGWKQVAQDRADYIAELQAAIEEKDGVLDRCQWVIERNGSGNHMVCAGCGREEHEACKSDCWWQKARKAGHE